MIISLKWLEQWLDLSQHSAEQLGEILTARGLEVEGIERGLEGLNDVRVARIVQIHAHPQSEKLHVVDLDVGPEGQKRVVCGAPKLELGWLVAFAPAGIRLGDKNIVESEIRGIPSQGMLCSEKELGLGTAHEGLLRLDDNAQAGMHFFEALTKMASKGLPHFYHPCLEIGLTPDRGDCLSQLGVARELAAALKQELKALPLEVLSELKPIKAVSVEAPELCPRYLAIKIDKLRLGPSPDWLRRAVEALGARSVNNVVDITNFVCFELGHPMHAFDLDKMGSETLCVRLARRGERLEAIDHNVYELCERDLVIANDKGPLAIAGVMGGSETEIDDKSQRILLEIAAFQPSTVRKTAKRLGLHSESSHRFERFVDPAGLEKAAARALYLLQLCQSEKLEILGYDEVVQEQALKRQALRLRPARVESILGLQMSRERILELLLPLGYELVSEDERAIEVLAPTWRSDITREIDIVEELCRCHGLEKIPACLPNLALGDLHGLRSESFNPTPYELKPTLWSRKNRETYHRLRAHLIAAGLHECLHYSFMEAEDLKRLRLPQTESDLALGISNPLSLEHAYMRTELLPSMLNAVRRNQDLQEKSCRLFEMGERYLRRRAGDIEYLDEENRLCLAFWGESGRTHFGPSRRFDIFDVKGLLEYLAKALESPLDFAQGQNKRPFLHDGVQAEILFENQAIGYLGEVHPSVLEAYKIDSPVYVADISIHSLYHPTAQRQHFQQLPRFPFSTRDLSLLVSEEVQYGSMAQAIQELNLPLLEAWELVDFYRGKQVPQGKKSLTLSFSYRDPNASNKELGHTLTDEEVSEAHAQVVAMLVDRFGIELR